MRIDRLAARVLAALARDDHDGRARDPLLAALSRDTPAFGGATAVATRGTGPRWTLPAALLRRAAPPAEHQPERPLDRPGHTDGPPRQATGAEPPRHANDDGAPRHGTNDGAQRRGTNEDGPRHGTNDDGLRHGTNDVGLRHGSGDVGLRHGSGDGAQRHGNGDHRHGTDGVAQRPATDSGPPRQARREPGPPPLFSMPDGTPPRRMPSTTTRRLCAAVHLDADLARRVVAELTDDPRRAVPPSVGFDLEPVLCHALRARLLATARDGFLTVAVLTALVLAPRTTAAVLLLGAAAGLGRAAPVLPVPPAGRALFVAALVFGLVTAVGAALTVLGAAAPAPPGTGELDRLAAAVGAAPGPRVWVAVAVLLVGAVAGHLAHLSWTAATLTAAANPAPLRAATARRVRTVAAAQRGNVAFSRADPFVGAGPRVRGWSVAVALRATDSGVYRPRSPATLDPVLLRRHVGQALQGLGDGGAGHAGVPGLAVTPYLAADGVRCAGDQLLDDGTPLPLASREVLDAVVRGPQEGLRHYDRVVIVPRARGVTTAEGRPVVPSDDGDGLVSVFVHTSIEASVVYVELSAHVLPPVQAAYYGSQAPAVHLETLTRLTGAPWRLARTAAGSLRAMTRRVHREGWHDHSARLGVREIANGPAAGLAALEATKHVQIVERVVVEAVADFLERYDLDATTFRAEVPTTR
ncbi:hypothetical protein ACFO1B_46130 [Dactylosporangium siamense]|uniref:hypothetical protein n=1 Tax=Dactylosporangium siamense TaxID=685454 RepID=UPI003622E276